MLLTKTEGEALLFLLTVPQAGGGGRSRLDKSGAGQIPGRLGGPAVGRVTRRGEREVVSIDAGVKEDTVRPSVV